MAWSIRAYRSELFAALETVAPSVRCTFGAACAQRLLPYLVTWCRDTNRVDPALIENALSRVWDWAREDTTEQITAKHLVSEIPLKVFEARDAHQWAFAASHCAAATAYALRAAAGHSARDAGWAGMRLLDAVDEFLQRHLFAGRQMMSVSEEDNRRIWENPVFVAEIARQRRDIERLRNVSAENRAAIVEEIRAAAVEESSAVFGSVE